jgi:hypothetical protein
MPNDQLLLDPPALPELGAKQNGTLILHCGGKRASWTELCNVTTPAATKTHHPLPHHRYVETVRDTLGTLGYAVSHETHALNKEGAHYFGLLALKQARTDAVYDFVIGLRNSHDKSVSARMALGSRVFVCDNLSFSGEVELSRKHTAGAETQLPHLLAAKLGQLGEVQLNYERRVDAYQQHQLTDQDAKLMLFDLMRLGVIPGMQLRDMWDQWQHPAHEDFQARTAWSLFNSATEMFKQLRSAETLVARTRRLHAAFDGWTGVRAHQLENSDLALEA